ncbi:MAG: isochorismatase family protein, partial [Nitrospirota bacterium]
SLGDRLEDLNVKTVFALGSATQDCLKQTVLDACKIGLQVVVLSDAIGSIGNSADSLNEIYQAGAIRATASDLGITSPFP